MKKLMLILALAASVQVAGAQNKSAASLKSAYESAQKAADDAKKNTKAPTWIKLGQTLLDAYSAPMGSVWIGASRQDFNLVMGGQKPLSTENVTISNKQYTKENYAGKSFFFDESNKLVALLVTEPIVENALDKALAAYLKAAELDTKGQKAKDISAAITSIQDKYTEEAYNSYTLGKYDESSVYFEKSADASAALGGTINADAVYNAGFAASFAGDNERAKSFFLKCLEIGNDGEGGEVYYKLADVSAKLGDEDGAREYLEKGFSKYPQNQNILIGLINNCVSKGEDTGRIFQLLEEAKKNEPTNASLWYVEGGIYEKLGNYEAALKSYDDASAVDPKYAFSYIGKGLLLSSRAEAILKEANDDITLNQAQYDAKVEEYYKMLKSSIEPFEKGFNLSTDPSVKSGIAAYLKSVCFRFREESADYMSKYEFYSKAAAEEEAQQ